MSGKQAKAKRKSAKKTAADSAPVSERPRTDFIIENVRCFAEKQRVPIRPITLLVGENSTGKTTFMACLYTALNNLVPSPKNIVESGVSFNTPPFSLGGFRDIARRQNDGKLVANEFGIGFVVSEPGINDSTSTMFSFGEKDMEASGTKIFVKFSDGAKLEIIREKSGAAISGPDFRVHGVELPPQTPFAFMSTLLFALFSLEEQAKDGRNPMAQKAHSFLKERLNLSHGDFMPEKLSTVMREGAEMMTQQIAMAFEPTRAKPKRTYSILGDDSESERTPAFLFRLSINAPEKWRALRKRLIAFGKESGMFSDFNVVAHGVRSGGDFHLEVKTRGLKSNIADVGYGVSQVYQFLVPVMRASQRKAPMVFMLQEPEVHLHPQAQAALAHFFAKSATEPGRGFIIETHGDGIIDRVRICVSHGVIQPEDVVILYFEPDKKTGAVKIHPVHVDKMGNIADAPPGYRRFFLEETNRLLRPPAK